MEPCSRQDGMRPACPPHLSGTIAAIVAPQHQEQGEGFGSVSHQPNHVIIHLRGGYAVEAGPGPQGL
jgi:hypothetical protein